MITLKAGGAEVPCNQFVEKILEATLKGALSTLRGGDNFIAALLLVENGLAVKLTINGQKTEMNDFVQQYLGGVLTGGVKALDKIENTDTIEIRIS